MTFDGFKLIFDLRSTSGLKTIVHVLYGLIDNESESVADPSIDFCSVVDNIIYHTISKQILTSKFLHNEMIHIWSIDSDIFSDLNSTFQ